MYNKKDKAKVKRVARWADMLAEIKAKSWRKYRKEVLKK